MLKKTTHFIKKFKKKMVEIIFSPDSAAKQLFDKFYIKIFRSKSSYGHVLAPGMLPREYVSARSLPRDHVEDSCTLKIMIALKMIRVVIVCEIAFHGFQQLLCDLKYGVSNLNKS